MFYFEPLSLKGLQIIRFDQSKDSRGSFSEVYRRDIFMSNGIPELVQENYSYSNWGVIRGLYYQEYPHEIGKLIRCVKGSIFDVAVDVRKDSEKYGKYYSMVMSENDDFMFWVPAGFAHGFCSLENNSVVLYKTSGYYSKEHEKAIRWDDPVINIDWPIRDVKVSTKDKKAKLLGLE